MTTTPAYPPDKQLTVDNAQMWDFHIHDSMSAFPLIGSAIRNNKKYVLPVPSANDTLLNSIDLRYNFITSIDGTLVLTKGSRIALRNAQDKYEIAEQKRLDEEAKVCTFLKSSFSVEMSMMLRSNPEYITADKANDSYEMYNIAKAITFRTSSFEATQHRVLQMFQCTMTTTHTAYKDEMLNHYKALLAMFGSKDPALEGTCKVQDLALVAYLAGLSDTEFKYPKDKLYADTPAGQIPDMLTVMQSMTQYDHNKRKVPTILPDLTPPGPTILSATASTSICLTCKSAFNTVISRKSGLPFTHCQSCNIKYQANRPPPVSTQDKVRTAHAAMVTATNAYHQANAVLLSATDSPDPPQTAFDAAYLNHYIQREYNL